MHNLAKEQSWERSHFQEKVKYAEKGMKTFLLVTFKTNSVDISEQNHKILAPTTAVENKTQTKLRYSLLL